MVEHKFFEHMSAEDSHTYLSFDRRQVDLFGPQIEFLHRNVLLYFVGLVVQLTLDTAQLRAHQRFDRFLLGISQLQYSVVVFFRVSTICISVPEAA